MVNFTIYFTVPCILIHYRQSKIICGDCKHYLFIDELTNHIICNHDNLAHFYTGWTDNTTCGNINRNPI